MNLFLLVVVAAVAVAPDYTLNLAIWFPDADSERAEREALLASTEAFGKLQAPTTAEELDARLETYGTLAKGLQKHDAYIYLKAERNRDDKDARIADDALVGAIDLLREAMTSALASMGSTKAHAFLDAYPALDSYRYFIDQTLQHAAHRLRQGAATRDSAQSSLDDLTRAYLELRRKNAVAQVAPGVTDRETFDAKWTPYVEREDAFAEILIHIVNLRDRLARSRGFRGAPEAAYFDSDLSADEVRGVLSEIRQSGAGRRYQSVVAGAAAHRLGLDPDNIRPWQLEKADGYEPPHIAFGDAVQFILAAEKPMGSEYAGHYAELFDPSAQRVDWCRNEECDDTGFSVGYAGVTSGLFYGNYSGTTNSVRAVAHEAGHAVHRQFMNEHQLLSMYNEGPRFVFESFAIFNELLLLDGMSESAESASARAYYAHRFLEDMTFQVYGSAAETDLEESIHSGVRDGRLRTSRDLDSLTLGILSRYNAGQALDDKMKVYWARNRLYFTDPFYDVNYLYAGLLALEYLRLFESDRDDFSRHYVALLKNGFTDTPKALIKQFLGIDMTDAHALVQNATQIIDERTHRLAGLYAE